MKIRDTGFDFAKKTYVMGILNVTPDSFSDGGLHNSTDAAVEHALDMIKDGADIIDIGGESTRPGYSSVPADVELDRVIPVIEALRRRSDIPISIDTTKAEVAAAAILAGADIINTVEGLDISEDMIKVARDSGAFIVMTYENCYVNQFGEALIGMAETAVEAGISPDRIIVDPGIGFGKTKEENLRILNELPIITQVGYPVLLGCSRKSVIGYFTGRDENGSQNGPQSGPQSGSERRPEIAKERLPGTLVTTVLAGLAGVGIVRVHDVKENLQALRIAEEITNGGL